ncbi:MAG: TonB-dependent receptor, partial [Gemmatimonadetes bacterium]|nr:TonB-dependent receptor [Gemmatimonadota bacterium]
VGQVREPGGRTLRGAWVTAEWVAGGRVARREGRSGVDGLFVFCDLPAGPTIRLRAAHTDRVGPASTVSVHAESIHRIDLALPQVVSERPGRLLGRVLDSGGGTGVALAELSIPGAGLRMWTDTNGHFAIDSLPPGVHTLRVEGLGYETREVAVVVAPDGAHGVEVPLSRDPIELGPVVVTVRSPRWFGDMSGFQRRMRLAAGFFLTRQDIARVQPARLLDLIREAPGVTVTERFGRAPTIRMRGRVCDPDLVVDRVPTRDRSLLADLRGADLEAVEVYRSVAENPGEWSRPGACGAIVVWTRRAVA